jgi:hypothetical protein
MQSLSSRRLVSPRLLTIIVTVILLSTVLFIVGVLIERSPGTLVPSTSSQQAAPVSAVDPDGGHEGTSSEKRETTLTGGSGAAGRNERVFGLDLENSWFVGASVLAWLVLIMALFRLGPIVWLVLLVVASVSTALDVGEVARKLGEANTTVVLIAGVVAVAHVLLVALAGLVLIRWRRGSTAPAGSGRVL